MKRAIVSGSARPGSTRPSADCAASSRVAVVDEQHAHRAACAGWRAGSRRGASPSISGSSTCATIARRLVRERDLERGGAVARHAHLDPERAARRRDPRPRVRVAVRDQHGRHALISPASLGTRSSRCSRNASDSASARSLEWNQRTRPACRVAVARRARRPARRRTAPRTAAAGTASAGSQVTPSSAMPTAERVAEHDELGAARRAGGARAGPRRARPRTARRAGRTSGCARAAGARPPRSRSGTATRRVGAGSPSPLSIRRASASPIGSAREPPLALARAAVLGRRAARARAAAPRAGWRRRDS